MTFCFHELLSDNPETADIYDLENYTKLISTVGAKLEANHKEDVDKNFDTILRLSKSKLIVPRLRFLFLDVLDLRKRGWLAKKKKPVESEEKKNQTLLGLVAASIALGVGFRLVQF